MILCKCQAYREVLVKKFLSLFVGKTISLRQKKYHTIIKWSSLQKNVSIFILLKSFFVELFNFFLQKFSEKYFFLAFQALLLNL
jgi:hypothetical protein